MDESRDYGLKALVANEPIDQAVILIITELRDHITRIRTGLVATGVFYPNPSEQFKYVDMQLKMMSEAITELMEQTLLLRLQDDDK
jgi:hypothetical protein